MSNKKAVSELGGIDVRTNNSNNGKNNKIQDESAAAPADATTVGGFMDGVAKGGGYIIGGIGDVAVNVGGALNPLQLLETGGKKKKKKDTRQYRSRNDVEFDDCDS
jgi:hypothetical protein